EIRKLLGAAGVQLKAMLLLGINAGFGNSDCGNLPLSAVDLEAGIIRVTGPIEEHAGRVRRLFGDMGRWLDGQGLRLLESPGGTAAPAGAPAVAKAPDADADTWGAAAELARKHGRSVEALKQAPGRWREAHPGESGRGWSQNGDATSNQ